MSEPAESIRVLHVDDEPRLSDMVQTFLEREDERIDVLTATTPTEGVDILDGEAVDCIVSDYDMPHTNGIEFLQTVREAYPDLPFILYTGKGSEEIAAEAISAGVTDYLQKQSGTDQYTILANRIVNAVERYRIERDAEQTRAQLQAITDHSADAILIVDADSQIRFANPAVEDLFGYTPTELQGNSVTMIMPDRYQAAHLDAVDRYLETGQRSMNWSNVEFPGQHKDGTELPLSISFGEFQQDGNRRFVGIIRDISERTRMEEELREREQRFRQLAENIQEVVWMSDPDKEEMIYVNPAYEEIWGRSPESLYEEPTSFLDAVHPEDRDRVEAALDTQASGAYDEEYRITRPDGELRWVWDRAIPVTNDAGEVYRIVGIASDITERKEQTRRLETLISNLPGIVYRCRNEPGWPMEFVKGECEALTGYPAQAIESGDVVWGEDIIHPADQDDMWEAVQDALADNRPFEVTYRIHTKSGATRWMWERGRLVDAEGADDPVLEGFITDITERKEQEQELRQKSNLLDQIFEQVPTHLYVMDEEARLQRVSEHYVDDPEERIGKTDRDIAPGEFGEEAHDDNLAVIQTGNPLINKEEYLPSRDKWGLTSKVPWYGEDGEIAGLIGVTRDITDRKKNERDLKRLQDRVEFALEATDSLVWTVDLDTEETTTLYGPLESLLGVGEADVASAEAFFRSAVHPEDRQRVEEVYQDVLQGETERFAVEFRTHPETGEERWIEASARLQEDDDGRRLTGISTDVTRRKHHEQEVEERNERLNDLVGVVSHDLRNPLNVAQARLDLATEECDSDHLAHVMHAHDRMETLIADLLTLAKEGSREVNTEPLTLRTVSQDCWENIMAGQSTLRVESERTIQADPSRLKQLLENLYRNAIEHGGEDVTVTVGDIDDGFYIEDDGPGIPADKRVEVFEAGYSTTEQGSGFGLNIVKQVVAAHDWEIRITEGSRGGARFEITGVDFVDA